MPFKNLILWVSSLCFCAALLAAPAQLFNAPKKTYTVAITQFADRPSLLEAHMGIVAGLKERGYSENKNVKFIFANAYGDFQAVDKIAKEFVKLKPDLIISITTPSTQAIVAADSQAKIPVVFSSVVDPVGAKIVPSLVQPGGHVTGVYDIPPVDDQVSLMRKIMPQLKTLGVVYNPNEANAVLVFNLLEKEANTFKILSAEVTSPNAVAGAVNSLIGKVDAFYIPPDNTVKSALEPYLKVTMENRLPVFASDHGSVRKGALAAIADNQYEIGYLAGRMAAAVLGGKDPGKMDVVRVFSPNLFINTETAKKLNIKIPENLYENAALIID